MFSKTFRKKLSRKKNQEKTFLEKLSGKKIPEKTFQKKLSRQNSVKFCKGRKIDFFTPTLLAQWYVFASLSITNEGNNKKVQCMNKNIIWFSPTRPSGLDGS